MIWRSNKKTTEFLEKGYPKKLLLECRRKVDSQAREDLLKAKNKDKDKKNKDEDKLFLITTYQPTGNPVAEIIEKTRTSLVGPKLPRNYMAPK